MQQSQQRGNRGPRDVVYVVTEGFESDPVAAFSNLNVAKEYAHRLRGHVHELRVLLREPQKATLYTATVSTSGPTSSVAEGQLYDEEIELDTGRRGAIDSEDAAPVMRRRRGERGWVEACGFELEAVKAAAEQLARDRGYTKVGWQPTHRMRSV